MLTSSVSAKGETGEFHRGYVVRGRSYSTTEVRVHKLVKETTRSKSLFLANRPPTLGLEAAIFFRHSYLIFFLKHRAARFRRNRLIASALARFASSRVGTLTMVTLDDVGLETENSFVISEVGHLLGDDGSSLTQANSSSDT
mmetsp:Transcript_13058/g.26492  ORF Transcript_13058/g.26492 Transcript_13058/m.26492 type:complete len:142 (-) Transcript_13058:439-864(-)